MPRRYNASQLRSKLQQAQTRRRQTIHKLNNAIRQHNSDQKRRVNAINQAVRSHNSRVRANRARLQSALQRLARQSVSVQFTSLRQSSLHLSTAYERLDNGSADPYLSDLAEQEAANSVSLVNVLLGDEEHPSFGADDIATSRITDSLSGYSEDLALRWTGAIFALNPGNPDAARHFCTSAREIMAGILDGEAPDAEVLAQFPDCDLTERRTPTRRAKVHYCLNRNGLDNILLEGFVEANIGDLTALFGDLNSGAHGTAGKYSLEQLAAIKVRVEDAIAFIIEIVS